MVWVLVGAPVLVVLILLVLSLCKVSAEADAAMERFRREGWL